MHLHDNHILCPSAYLHEKGLPVTRKAPKDPCKWHENSISYILGRIDYLGHTLNFRTTKQSYKSNKILLNDPESWVIFENTQEPIIEESIFSIVQNLRQSKKRPTKLGTPNIFLGLMYCASCGKIMYYNRVTSHAKKNEYFVCSGYRHKITDCVPHTIREVLLQEIILRNLQEAIAYVSEHEKDFIHEVLDTAIKGQENKLTAKKDALKKSEKRISELDSIIKRLYEDNLSGKITDERFVKLSRDYENEQDELNAIISATRRELKEQGRDQVNTQNFIAVVQKYTNLQKLDATVLREFISRINISAADKKTKTQNIQIDYNFIGKFDFETAINKCKI